METKANGLLTGYTLSWSLSKPRSSDLAKFNLSVASILTPTRDPHVVLFDASPFSGGILNRNVKLPFDVVVKATLTTQSTVTQGDLLVRVVSTPFVLMIENSNRTLSSLGTFDIVGVVTRGGRFAQEIIQYAWTCQEQSPPFIGELKTCNLYWTTNIEKSPEKSTAYLLDPNVAPNTLYLFRFSAFASDGRSSETFGFFISPRNSNTQVNNTYASTSIELFTPILKKNEARAAEVITTRLNTQNRLRALGLVVI